MGKKSGKNQKVYRIENQKLCDAIPATHQSDLTAEELYNIGEKYTERKEYYLAIEYVEAALEIAPEWQEAWHCLGELLFIFGQSVSNKLIMRKSIDALTKSIKLKPNNIESLIYRAQVYEFLEEPEMVSIDRNMVKKIEPTDYEGWMAKGTFLNLLFLRTDGKENFKLEATQCYRKALELDPNNEEGWLNLGITYIHLKDYNQAVVCLEKAIGLNPLSKGAWHHLGDTMEKLERYDRALFCFDELLLLQPENINVVNRRGEIIYKLGKYDEAIKIFRQVIQRKPTYSQGWLNLGKALEEKGDLSEAINCYDQSLILESEDEETKKQRKKAMKKLDEKSKVIVNFEPHISED